MEVGVYDYVHHVLVSGLSVYMAEDSDFPEKNTMCKMQLIYAIDVPLCVKYCLIYAIDIT